MTKSASPIRLQAELMQAAQLTGKLHHRSTAEQVEYWADMGRRIASVIDPDALLSITAGLAKIKIEPVNSKPVNPDKVFQSLEKDRRTGALPRSVTTSAVKYQVSEEHPGYLVQIDKQDNHVIGQFKDGSFIPLDNAKE